MMKQRRRGTRLSIGSIAGAALVLLLAHGPIDARHPDLELDALSDAAIDALLQAELDDEDLIDCGLANPNAPVPTQQMLDIVMCALDDDDDDDDEDDVDEDDLEAEMEEANTTLEAEVRKALQRADAIASGPPDASLRVAAPADALAAEPAPASTELHALQDGRINPGKAAVVPVKLAIRAAIRAAR